MSEARYVDPNSGAAPQPGGYAATIVDAEAKDEPTSPQDAEVSRQAEVTKNQAEAKQGEKEATAPKEAKRPEVKDAGGSENKK